MNKMNKWDKREYRSIKSASVKHSDVFVVFGNGDRITLPVNLFEPPDLRKIDWTQIEVDTHEITFGSRVASVAVPWSKIRILTDPEYRAYIQKKSSETSERAGAALRLLRRSRGLSSKEVAQKAGISAQSLSRIENGHHDVVFSTLQQLLNAMGCSLRDLAEASADEEAAIEKATPKRPRTTAAPTVWTQEPDEQFRAWQSQPITTGYSTPPANNTTGRNRAA